MGEQISGVVSSESLSRLRICSMSVPESTSGYVVGWDVSGESSVIREYMCGKVYVGLGEVRAGAQDRKVMSDARST